MPAVKKSVLDDALATPRPNCSAQTPGMWIGVLPASFTVPRKSPESKSNALILPSPKLPTKSALSKLPKRQREVVALRYLADLTEADTASVLGVTVGTVKQHGRRALQAMRERLGVDPTFGWEE